MNMIAVFDSVASIAMPTLILRITAVAIFLIAVWIACRAIMGHVRASERSRAQCLIMIKESDISRLADGSHDDPIGGIARIVTACKTHSITDDEMGIDLLSLRRSAVDCSIRMERESEKRSDFDAELTRALIGMRA